MNCAVNDYSGLKWQFAMNEQNIDDPKKKINIFHTADFSLKLSENAT